MNVARLKRFIEERYVVRLGVSGRGSAQMSQYRQYYYHLALTMTDSSLAAIGDPINRDHSLVLHGIKSFNDLYAVDKEYRNEFNLLRETLDIVIRIESAMINESVERILDSLKDRGIKEDIMLEIANKLTKVLTVN